MATSGKTDGQLWVALAALEDELFDATVSEQTIDDQLKALGLDPAAISKRGAEFVARAQEKERLAWQAQARARQAELERRAASSTIRPKDMSREALLARLEELRTATPALSSTIRMAARKRRPEESSDDELRTLLEEMEALREIDKG